MEERERFLKHIRKDNLCGKEEEPLALLVFGALMKGPNFRRACSFAGLSRHNKDAKKWWANMHNGGFMTTKKIHFNPEGENTGIEFCLAMIVARGYLEMKKA